MRIPAGDGRDSNGDFSAPHMYDEGVKIKTGASWVGVSVLLNRPGELRRGRKHKGRAGRGKTINSASLCVGSNIAPTYQWGFHDP